MLDQAWNRGGTFERSQESRNPQRALPSGSEFMALAPDRLWSRDVEKAVAGEGEGEMGMRRVEGPFL